MEAKKVKKMATTTMPPQLANIPVGNPSPGQLTADKVSRGSYRHPQHVLLNYALFCGFCLNSEFMTMLDNSRHFTIFECFF